jgi:hypothetical protein
MRQSPYIPFKKEDLIEKISKLDIIQEGNQIITKYNDRVLKTTTVSNRYEIFDIKGYLIDQIDFISSNFPIHSYKLDIRGGIQSLDLLSDVVKIGDSEFYKGFFLLNSSDKSRALNFNAGLYNKTQNWYYIWGLNVNLYKKHLKGVTSIANDKTAQLNDETFSEQIEMLTDLVDHKVSYKEVVKVISPTIDVKVNLAKLESFNQSILYLHRNNKILLTKEQLDLLKLDGEQIHSKVDNFDNFYFDAFTVFRIYLGLFNRQDSYLIKKETDKISKITQSAIRDSLLESLGI